MMHSRPQIMAAATRSTSYPPFAEPVVGLILPLGTNHADFIGADCGAALACSLKIGNC